MITQEELICLLEGDEVDGAELVESGDWIDEGRHIYSEFVISCDGKFYKGLQSRSGSYFSGYDYEPPLIEELVEVERVEEMRVVTVWQAVSRTADE